MTDLFRSEHSRAARGLRSRGHDAEDADDLVQDAFERLAAMRQTETLRCPEAYLQRVLRNLVADRARRSRRRASTFVPLDENTLPRVEPTQEHELELQDLRGRYRDAVCALTPRTREVFLLHRVDELTYSQIARRLGISVSTVEYHIIRALVHLDGALRR